jgi:hypothetical protein
MRDLKSHGTFSEGVVAETGDDESEVVGNVGSRVIR